MESSENAKNFVNFIALAGPVKGNMPSLRVVYRTQPILVSILPQFTGGGTYQVTFVIMFQCIQNGTAEFGWTVPPGITRIGQVSFDNCVTLANFVVNRGKRHVLCGCTTCIGLGVIGENDIEQSTSSVALDSSYMVSRCKTTGFTFLHCDVADINTQRAASANGLSNTINHQV